MSDFLPYWMEKRQREADEKAAREYLARVYERANKSIEEWAHDITVAETLYAMRYR